MKRLLHFILAFLIALIAVYMEPVLFLRNQVEAPKEPADSRLSPSVHKSLPYYELNTSGLAGYIGKSKDELMEDFQNVRNIWQSPLGFEWLVYGDNPDNYIQIGVRDQKVVTIFSLGSENDTAPFSKDMTLTDISEITTIFSNFSFDYNDETYDVELSEEDMNYRPLVAFNNGAFAILHLDRDNGRIIGIRYLDKQQLLELMPYQLVSANPLPHPPVADDRWETVNRDSAAQMVMLLNMLRETGELGTYQLDNDLTNKAEAALKTLIETPDEILQDKARRTMWQSQETAVSFETPFALASDETDRMIQSSRIDSQTVHGIGYAPAFDVPFLLMDWLSNHLTATELSHKSDTRMGVAFDRNVMFILFDTDTQVQSSEKTESSDSSS
ncbi:CAP-associated domain-containing protein [Vagococcus acidifermentans]|uniref:CAP-associated domain-containing protein n=1 Tax=Vagococcus acidifermentans TaxID=564710 RepID=A0A430B0J7_9ENTE|nr:CAP-associated domain-containing protein [Vagococcus acidifermentans]RSU13742.1 hypothetical protein CBF27_02245 [Vagococcus acidifermentans]